MIESNALPMWVLIYALPLGGALAIGLIWWLITRKPATKKIGNVQDKEDKEAITCLLIDSITSRWYKKVNLTKELVNQIEENWHSLGLEWDTTDGKAIAVNRYAVYDKDGNATIRYRPAQVMFSPTVKVTPPTLYNHIVLPEVKMALPLQVKKGMPAEFKAILIWLAAILFVGWLWTQGG